RDLLGAGETDTCTTRRGGGNMAKCERGYLCAVCGEEVEGIAESDLYLSYVLGEVSGEELLNHPERHIRCNTERARYIVHPSFPVVRCAGMFAKESIDPEYVRSEEERITKAWRRLQELPASGAAIGDYPLDDSSSSGS